MSYRCQKCNVVCEHSQIQVVTKTRTRRDHSTEIAEELAVCESCAVNLKINVVNLRRPVANGAGIVDNSEQSVLVGSA